MAQYKVYFLLIVSCCFLKGSDSLKVTATIFPLPALMQTDPLCEGLYKLSSAGQNGWRLSCGLYAVFHLVNTWQCRSNSVELAKQFERENFTHFVGFLDAKKIKLGPTAISQLTALVRDYACLSGAQGTALQYVPVVANVRQLTLVPGNAGRADVKQFTSYLKMAVAGKDAFVFPLLINTTRHATSALVYKLADEENTSKRFVIFFADSYGNLGHVDSGVSPAGESFNFATLFKQLLAMLTDKEDIAVVGPIGDFVQQDVQSVLASCDRQIAKPEQVYAWQE